jgi:hypothetical protein
MRIKKIDQMHRTLLLALVAVLFSANLYGQDTKKPSQAVERILNKAVMEVRKNRQEFDKANQKPLGDARVELQDLSTKLIKDGKTVDATAVLKQIETLDVDVMKRAGAPEPAPMPRPTPQKLLLEKLVGRWQRPGYEYVIGADGMIRASDGDGGRLVLVSPEIAEVIWKTGTKTQYLMAHDDIACGVVLLPNGSRKQIYVLERVK